MEIYVVDDSFDRLATVDRYKSFIWAERYADLGDFKLVVPATDENRSKIRLGSYLSFGPSDRHMLVATAEEQNGFIEFSGPSMEFILKTRVVKPGVTWSGQLAECAAMQYNFAFVKYLANKSFSEDDVIPNSVYRYENIGDDTYSYTTKFQSVYDGIKEVVDVGDLGFRISLEVDDAGPKIALTIYGGDDKTNLVFDPRVGTLESVRKIRSISQLASTSITKYSHGGKEYYGTHSARRTFSGDKNTYIPKQLGRSVIPSDATDIERNLEDDDMYWRSLRMRAYTNLADKSYVRSVTGQMPRDNPFKYNVDYKLGDIVRISTAGDATLARVSEYIWSISATEVAEYPTFRFN